MGNLNLPQIASNQAQKYQTSNDADEALDLALTETLAVNLTAGDETLTDLEFRESFTFVCSGHAVPRTLTVPAIARPFGVVNDGSDVVSVECGTTSIDVAAGASALFQTDGSADGLYRLASGDAPTVAANPYDVGASYPGVPTSGATLLRYPFPRAVTFPAAFAASRCICGTPATAKATFSIKKNGVQVGTMVFPTGSPNNVGYFTMAGDTTFNAGDVMTVVAPVAPDVSLADIGFGLAGER